MHTHYIAYYLGRKKDNPKTHWIDQVICFFTDSKYSHVELVYDYSPDSKIGLCASSSPRDGGVRITSINLASGHWEVYAIKSELSQDDILRFFDKETGKKYDWLGAIGVVIPLFKNKSSRWFCSEIVGACLGLPNPKKLSPQDIFDFYKDSERIL